MEKKINYSIPGCLYSNQFYFFICIGCLVFGCCSYETNAVPYDSFTISSFTYGRTVLRPYDWRYIRVDLPTWFSSMTLSLESDVNLDKKSIMIVDKNNLPMICAREGSPPLPDSYNTSLIGLELDPILNGSLAIEGLQFAEKCYPMQKKVMIRLTNEQISPGVWYFGLFNGIGSTRTQSKMINRGSGYSFTGNVSVEGCVSPSISGQFCNQTVDHLSCVDQKSTQGIITSCKNDFEGSCIDSNESKLYSLDLLGISEEIMISLKSNNSSNTTLMCYARHGAIPSSSTHDYSGNVNNAPLVIRSPKVGRWYFTILPLNFSNEDTKFCYSLEWKLLRCPINKAGLNCTWERYTLQTILRKNPSVPFESYYLPVSDKISSNSANFLLEPLLSNSSQGQSQSQSQHIAWTYFLVDIPSGAAGGSIHIRLTSDTKINHELYASYGGLPFEDKWDYFYANSSSNSNGSMFFKLYASDEKTISFYIVYVRGGTWSFGIKHLTSSSKSQSQSQTTMSISIERCPRRCSSHGTCQNVVEMSGLSLYSYCSCDRDHGGFDCSVEIVSHQGHIWQSISLIASNAAFVFPAYWALRQGAFAEWVLYTCSGISSGLYHACDVGTWCVLSYKVLQFMDFWLSFMAVVGTFVYVTDIDEGSKRTIHTVVAIVTALMAMNGPTSSMINTTTIHRHRPPRTTMDLLLVEKALIALFAAIIGAIFISKLRGKKFKLPPGPIPVPIFGNWLQVGDDLNHRNLTDLAKKFGEIFLLRMGQRNLVVVSSPDLAKEVLHTQGVEFGSRTRNVVFDIFTGKGQDMVFTVYGEHWRKMRRIMTVPFFTNKVVQQYRHGWEAEAAAVVEDVKKNPASATEGIVIRRRLQLMMYNNMFRIMFDRRFESEDDPLFLKLKALNGERSRLAQSFEYNYGDFIPILRPFLRSYLKLCKEVKEKRLQLFKDYFVDERKKLGSTKKLENNQLKCAIDHILEAKDKGEINEDNVLYIVENINVAAIETTLWSIEWGIAELVNHPDIQSKLRHELDTKLGPGVQITEPDVQNLPYLQAVVKETLRLRMAIPLLVPHMNLHDAKLAGHDIPAESKILVNAWWLANNPEQWKKPEEFRPERFLEEEAKVEANGNDFRYLPFGVGRRSCPGIILALPILGITIGRLIQNFELLPPPGQTKIDTSEKGGQFSLHILKHSTVVAKPRSF